MGALKVARRVGMRVLQSAVERAVTKDIKKVV